MVDMTLKELINRVSWVKIEEKLLAIYPEESDSLHYYKKLYWTLSNLEADENSAGKIIEFELLGEEEAYYEEHYDEFDDFDVLDDEFSMSVEKWKEFLGYFIPNSLLKETEESEVIAHTFVEATYGGFVEK